MIIKVIKDIRLSDNFMLSEFMCKCGCDQVKISELHVKRLQLWRDRWKVKMIPNCGYRCPEHNKALGSKNTSQHLLGTATDFPVFKGCTLEEMMIYAQLHFDGVGVYNWGIHVDSRGSKAFWDERT